MINTEYYGDRDSEMWLFPTESRSETDSLSHKYKWDLYCWQNVTIGHRGLGHAHVSAWTHFPARFPACTNRVLCCSSEMQDLQWWWWWWRTTVWNSAVHRRRDPAHAKQKRCKNWSFEFLRITYLSHDVSDKKHPNLDSIQMNCDAVKNRRIQTNAPRSVTYLIRV